MLVLLSVAGALQGAHARRHPRLQLAGDWLVLKLVIVDSKINRNCSLPGQFPVPLILVALQMDQGDLAASQLMLLENVQCSRLVTLTLVFLVVAEVVEAEPATDAGQRGRAQQGEGDQEGGPALHAAAAPAARLKE